jgi:hypothetical protein
VARYELHQVTARFPVIGWNLVSARTIVASPFPNEQGAIYVGGYDANDAPARDTAWIARGLPGRVVRTHGVAYLGSPQRFAQNRPLSGSQRLAEMN